ncbi:MAG: S26 family signal peptidase [Salinirussus sp.]
MAGPQPEDRDASEGSWRPFIRDLIASMLAVALVGAYLFAVSGVWPPLVAVESGSMEPNMQRNDLVFVMEEHRFAGPGAVGSTGVVTRANALASNYSRFGAPGDVIVYRPDGNGARTPIIHRAMFWVEAGENWVKEADDSHLGTAQTCADIEYCPADHAGFITKGDANRQYDQVEPSQLSRPVRPEWVVGTAELRIPGLGWLRLRA